MGILELTDQANLRALAEWEERAREGGDGMNAPVDFDAIPLLAGLDAPGREAVAAASRTVDAATGHPLLPAFTVTDALWVLLDGR